MSTFEVVVIAFCLGLGLRLIVDKIIDYYSKKIDHKIPEDLGTIIIALCLMVAMLAVIMAQMI